MKFNLLKQLMFFGVMLCSSVMLAQTVTGTVTSNDGTLPGVSVIVKGTTNGASTDFDGKYSIDNVASDAVLVFSFVGYATQEVPVNGQSTIDVKLEEDSQALDEVVVVGYGTTTRKEVTTAVTSIGEDDFNQGVINEPTQLLQGKVAGLSVYNRGGDPNSNPIVRLRGLSTLGGNTEPLVVIDGVLGQSLSNVDPSDIQNITVLKDGSAAAIYGTRGSSGVILVTTKSGKSGQPFSVSYNGQLSTSSISNEIETMGRNDFLAIGGSDLGSDTDWRDEVTRVATTTVHNIAAVGGADDMNYRVSLNFRDNEGILLNSGFNQFNARAKVSGKILNDKLKIDFNSSLTQRDSDFGFREALRYAVLYNPTAPVFGADAPFAFNSDQFGGYFETLGLFDSFNPVSIANQNKNYGSRSILNYSVDFRYTLTDELSANITVGQQNEKNQNRQYYPTTSFFNGNALSPFRKGRADFYSNEIENKTFEVFATWDKPISDNFTLKLTGGYSWQETNYNEYYLQIGDFPPGVDFDFSDQIEVAQDLTEGGRIIANSGRNDDDRIIAFFARANATINDAIYVNASLRREGSSRFGEDNKWGIFPSAAIGADLNQFLELDNVNLLKVRLGYGVTGAIPSGVGFSQRFYPVNGSSTGFDPFRTDFISPRAANPDLGWEEKRETNLGVEFSTDRFSAVLDLYNRDIVDFILNVPVPPADFDGANNQFQNSGEANTKGIELALNYDLVQNDKVNYNTGIIFSTSRTELVKYLDGVPRMIANLGSPGQNSTNMIIVREGEQIGQIWGPVFTGDVDGNGSPILADLNGDGNLVTNQDDALAEDGDFQVLGKGIPDFELSWTNQVTIGKWDINAFFRGAFGHSLVNTFRAFYEPRIGSQSSYNFVNTELARDDIRTAQFSSYYVEKADFFKLDNLSIGYNFDVNSDYIKNIRLSLAGQNLFTITNYTGADPEPSLSDDLGGGGLLAPGIDRRNNYFASRTFTFGLNINF